MPGFPFSWALRFSRSALGSGVPVQLSPFRVCLSGSSEHGRGSVSSSGHPAGVFFCLIARLRPGLGLALAFLGNPCLGFQWLSFRERVQCPLLRHGDVVLRDLPCSSVGGLHCPGPVNTRRIAWETVITCGCGQVSWSAWGDASLAVHAVPICHKL